MAANDADDAYVMDLNTRERHLSSRGLRVETNTSDTFFNGLCLALHFIKVPTSFLQRRAELARSCRSACCTTKRTSATRW